MNLSHRYKNFGNGAGDPESAESLEIEQIEEQKLQSFEKGYRSGWDDAVQAQETTRANVSAEFARNLQEISFSYHEARSALVKEMRDVIEPLLTELLPAIARETLAAHLLEQISDANKDALERKIEVAVPPARLETMQTLFDDTLAEPFVMVEDQDLAEDQVFLRLQDEEREINFEPWLGQVRDTLTAYFDSIAKD